MTSESRPQSSGDCLLIAVTDALDSDGIQAFLLEPDATLLPAVDLAWQALLDRPSAESIGVPITCMGVGSVDGVVADLVARARREGVVTGLSPADRALLTEAARLDLQQPVLRVGRYTTPEIQCRDLDDRPRSSLPIPALLPTGLRLLDVL